MTRKAIALTHLVLALVLFAAAPAAAQEVAGVVERLRGEAVRIGTDGTQALAEGVDVRVNDALRTGAGARMIVRFRDNSALTLGENAQIVIDEMVYVSPAVSATPPRQAINILGGVFRYVSGAIGHAAPDRVSLRTSVASIGIRGTRFIGGELATGAPAGQRRYGFQIEQGAIAVVAPGGTVVLANPGEGTFLPLTGTAAPTPPRQWSPAAIAEVAAALAF